MKKIILFLLIPCLCFSQPSKKRFYTLQNLNSELPGINWTLVSTPTNNGYVGLAYSPELLTTIATASDLVDNNVLVTEDGGLTFTQYPAASNVGWHSCAWGSHPSLLYNGLPSPTGGIFLAASTTGALMVSADGGKNFPWLLVTSPTANAHNSVAYIESLHRFVIVATTGASDRVITSDDGETFTVRVSAANNQWRSVDCTNSLCVSCASTGGSNQRVMTSPDGITWTIRTCGAGAWSFIKFVSFLNLWVATSASGTANNVQTSPDGITWTLRGNHPLGQWGAFGASDENLVAVGRDGPFMYSLNAIDWTTVTSPSLTNIWFNIIWQPDFNRYLAVSTTGTSRAAISPP